MRLGNPAIIVIWVIIMCSACSKTAANKRNFKAAIQTQLDHEPACITVSAPKEVPSFRGEIRTDANSEVLVQAGLMNRVNAMVKVTDYFSIFDPHQPKEIPGYRYDLTDAGKKYIGSDGRPISFFRDSPQQELCYGRRHVLDVVRYTEPGAAFGGVTATDVTYTWKLTEVAAWAKESAVEKAFFTGRQVSAEMEHQEAHMSLVLSNDGWHAPARF